MEDILYLHSDRTYNGGVKYPDVQSVLANLLLVEYHSGNAEWWFLGTYMELLLLFPIVHRIKGILDICNP